MELKASLKNRDNTIGQLQKASAEQQPAAGQIAQLNAAIGQKDGELQVGLGHFCDTKCNCGTFNILFF